MVGINDRDVILNIGFKSDGLVPLAEFKDLSSLKIGDKVSVGNIVTIDLNGDRRLIRDSLINNPFNVEELA